MGDTFYRWDGFKYYASFSEFLPSVALATILWSFVAVFFSAVIWISLGSIRYICIRIGCKMKIDHGLIFIGSFAFFGSTIWIAKRYLKYTGSGTLLYMAVFLGVAVASSFLTWSVRDKAEKLMRTIQERITPLVWLFSIIVIFSAPIVGYYSLVNKTDHIISQKKVLPNIKIKNRPNIILVTFDALTARNMSVYGYQRPTTPFLEKWAGEASLFTKLEAESVITTPTAASLMTGKRLWTHQTYQLKGSKPDKIDTENLPLLLKNSGYSTMAFVVNPFASVKTLGLENDFDIAPFPTQFHGPVSLFGYIEKFLYQLFGDKIKLHDWILQRDFVLYRVLQKFSQSHSTTSFPPENAFKRLLWIIDENLSEPFFAWIHLYPPHDPYLSPKPFMGMFNSSLNLRSNKSHHDVKEKALSYRDKFQEFPSEIIPEINMLKDRYDEFVRYCDKQFQYLIAQLTKRKGLRNSIIILSSDHGESFQHGAIQHSGFHLYEQVTHIPLIIKEFQQAEGRIINDVVEQIDIPATILEFTGVPIPLWMEGRSLVPLIHGEKISSKPALSMTLMRNPVHKSQITKGTIAVWEGDYKLIHYLEKDKNMLFNLRQDPEEIHNLFDIEPDISQRLLVLIKENLEKANEKISRGQ
jgi:arylsulfatase A-like enzyme